MQKIIAIEIIAVTCIVFLTASNLYGQSNISFQCKTLNIDKTSPLKCDAISEDDPGDLAEAYSYLITYFAGGTTDQRFELRFPSRLASYHWTQTSSSDKNDSLAAELIYNTNPKVYGYTLDAFPTDFTITVTRYDNTKGGIIEGKFEGTMQSELAWSQQTVTIPVKGTFRTIRTGKAGDECRKQRNSEKEVINKAVKIFDETFLQPLQGLGWQITEEKNGLTTQIADHPAPFRPLFMCSDFFSLKLSLDPNSAYSKMIRDSAEYYNKQLTQNTPGTKEYSQASQNFFRIQTMQTAEISIAANDPYLKENYSIGSKDRATVLNIPGTAYAWQLFLAPTDELGTPEEKTMLFFGNWNGVNMHSGTYVTYPFIHKQHGAFIENFVVTITAPASTADKIIQNIDWSKLNEAVYK
jgi:hypothetical protein